MPRLSTADLDHVLEHTPQVWDQLRGSRLFITGGTGFFGTWLLESLVCAVDRFQLPLDAVVLTRSPESFADKSPHLAGHRSIRFHQGDVRDFISPEGRFTHVIHAAFPSTKPLSDPRETTALVLQGTERTLDFVEQSRAQHLLFISSGAVYGRQPANLDAIPESYAGGPDISDPRSAYGESKRMAELLCRLQAQPSGVAVKVARCFAFVGPHLPLDAHFAIGNFIRDAMQGGPIHIRGDGTAVRSYLYAADLAAWLWTILVAGKPGQAYNVGGAEAVSMAELARRVRDELAPGAQIHQARAAQPGQSVDRYVPDVTLAASELQLKPWITLEDAISRTANWAGRCAPATEHHRTTVTKSSRNRHMPTVKIGKDLVGDGQPCYVIAEIGINHNGDIQLAKKLIETAEAAGCNAVKFQKRTIDVVYSKEELARPRESPFGETNGDLKRGLEFGLEAYREIDGFCKEEGIPWFASCWDEASADFIAQFNPPCYKIASASLTDDNLLKYHRKLGKPLILSTGMSTIEQVDHAVELLGTKDLVLMHTCSAYPSYYDELNLRTIATLRERYKVPVGYSGHETGIPSSVAAAALGASCIERHITLDRSMWGSDHAASLEPNGITRLVRDIRLVETAMGDGVKRVYPREVPVMDKLRRVGK